MITVSFLPPHDPLPIQKPVTLDFQVQSSGESAPVSVTVQAILRRTGDASTSGQAMVSVPVGGTATAHVQLTSPGTPGSYQVMILPYVGNTAQGTERAAGTVEVHEAGLGGLLGGSGGLLGGETPNWLLPAAVVAVAIGGVLYMKGRG